MGIFFYPMTIIGPVGEITLETMVDTGATYTFIPRPILERIGVRPSRKRPFVLADGRVMEYDVAFVTARIDGEEGPTICIFGDPDTEPLLGIYTLEGFLLGIDPVNQTLIPVTGRLKGQWALSQLP